MQQRRLAAGLAVVSSAVAGTTRPAGATHGSSDESSCVAYFVTGISPGARGSFLSATGAQSPGFQPFGANVVSVQATTSQEACPFQPPPL